MLGSSLYCPSAIGGAEQSGLHPVVDEDVAVVASAFDGAEQSDDLQPPMTIDYTILILRIQIDDYRAGSFKLLVNFHILPLLDHAG